MGPSQQFLRNRLLEHHPQRIRSRSPFGAWGREEKQKDCKIDSVNNHQFQYLTILQDNNFIPGGFDYMRFMFAHYPTTLRDQWQSFGQLQDDPGELFFLAFPSAVLSAGGSGSQSSRLWVEHQMLELFSLPPRH
jgi:hypothetical protein